MDYGDLYKIIQSNNNFTSQVKEIFDYVRKSHPELGRISIAAYRGGVLSTYYSVFEEDHIDNSLEFKPVTVNLFSSLGDVIVNKKERYIDNLKNNYKSEHLKMLTDFGLLSSLTFPIVNKDNVIGVIFFNSSKDGFFSTSENKAHFSYIYQLISTRYIQITEEREKFQQLLDVALKIGHHRDPETSQHLIRMGMYSELLARLLADRFPEITTEFIHKIRFYAPFHDIGKYRIPDKVLFSNSIFSPEDREIMNMHPIYGEEIINDVISISGVDLNEFQEITLLKNIIRYHHEAYDGSGYPDGLNGSNIPLESRIITVADVFDALLSKRPYKEAWSISKVVDFLNSNSGKLFDPDCVEYLTKNLDSFTLIRSSIIDK